MSDFCQTCSRITKDGHEHKHWICADCREGEPTDNK